MPQISAGVLGTALSEAERAQQDKECTTAASLDANDSCAPLTSPSSSVAAAVTMPKFNGAHFLTRHEDGVVPWRQSQLHSVTPSASLKEFEELKARLSASDAQVEEQGADALMATASELEDACTLAEEELANVCTASRVSVGADL